MRDHRILQMLRQKFFQSDQKAQDMEICLLLVFSLEATIILGNLITNLDIILILNQTIIKAHLFHLFMIIEIDYLVIIIAYQFIRLANYSYSLLIVTR